MGPEREVFGALMVTGIDGQSPGTVEAQFRFRGGHAHKFAINKCHFFSPTPPPPPKKSGEKERGAGVLRGRRGGGAKTFA